MRQPPHSSALSPRRHSTAARGVSSPSAKSPAYAPVTPALPRPTTAQQPPPFTPPSEDKPLSLFFFLMIRHPPKSTLFPSPALFRSAESKRFAAEPQLAYADVDLGRLQADRMRQNTFGATALRHRADVERFRNVEFSLPLPAGKLDRKSTRLNSSHSQISYAVFCLTK